MLKLLNNSIGDQKMQKKMNNDQDMILLKFLLHLNLLH